MKTIDIIRNACYNIIREREQKPEHNKEEKKMTEVKTMLEYLGYESLKQFGEDLGYYNMKDAERTLKDLYEEETAPYQK